MKKIFVTFLILPFLAAAAPASQTNNSPAATPGGIAAIVNDSVVTMTDIEERIDLYLSGTRAPADQRLKMRQEVLDKLIDEALQMQAAKKFGITVDEGQVSSGFEFVAKQNNLSPDEFRKRLKDSGVNVDTLFDQLRAEIAWTQVVRRQLRPQVSISESEIDMTIDQLAQSGGKKQYHVAEIFLPVPEPQAEKDVQRAAEDAVTRIRGGEKFSVIARAISQAPGAAGGGDLGWMTEGQLEPALDKALAGMNIGQLSAPIRGEKGWYVLFLRNTREGGSTTETAPTAAPADPAQGPVVLLKQILIPVTNKDSESVIKAKFARGAALKKEIKSCDDLDKRMKDFPAKGTGTIGEGPESAMSPELRAIVSKLAVNELSAPLKTPAGWGMLMVCSRKTPGEETAAAEKPAAEAANPADKSDEKTREKMAEKLGTQRLGKMADHYLRDLRATAFIDKRI